MDALKNETIIKRLSATSKLLKKPNKNELILNQIRTQLINNDVFSKYKLEYLKLSTIINSNKKPIKIEIINDFYSNTKDLTKKDEEIILEIQKYNIKNNYKSELQELIFILFILNNGKITKETIVEYYKEELFIKKKEPSSTLENIKYLVYSNQYLDSSKKIILSNVIENSINDEYKLNKFLLTKIFKDIFSNQNNLLKLLNNKRKKLKEKEFQKYFNNKILETFQSTKYELLKKENMKIISKIENKINTYSINNSGKFVNSQMIDIILYLIYSRNDLDELSEYLINLYEITKNEFIQLRKIDETNLNNVDDDFYLRNIRRLESELKKNRDINSSKILQLGNNGEIIELKLKIKIKNYDVKVSDVLKKLIENEKYNLVLNHIFKKFVKSIFNEQFISRKKDENKTNKLYFYNVIEEIMLYIGNNYWQHKFKEVKLDEKLQDIIDDSDDDEIQNFLKNDFFLACAYYSELNCLKFDRINELTDENWNKINNSLINQDEFKFDLSDMDGDKSTNFE
jgi:hypothetical protein